MMIRSMFILGLILSSHFMFAQQSGTIEFKALGLQFTIPTGWIGQETEAGYLMGSNTQAGFILLLPHQTQTLAALETEARQEIADQNGTVLRLTSAIEKVGTNGISAEYTGTLEWQAAKAHLVGLVNPYGNGLTVMAATTEAAYNSTYKDLALQVAKSVRFSPPVIPPISNEWAETLKNARLTYMHTYSSNSGSYDGYSTGGGFSDKIVIDLCGQGYFKHSSSSSMSIDTGGAFGSSSSSGKGAGTWKVVGNAQGQPVLQLNFYDGSVSEYVISYEDSKTYLNGTRYFRTYGTTADDGPDCY